MEPPWLKIKKFLVFFQKKVFLIFPEMELSSSKLKKLFIFQEGIFQAQKIKKFHSENHTFLVLSCILSNGTFYNPGQNI